MKAKLTDSVDQASWQLAQQWEKNHWVSAQKSRAKYGKNIVWRFLHTLGLVDYYRGDDWNLWWKKQFDDYAFLPKTVANAIEVGCGPYTNMRHVMQRCKPDHLFLSDPLIRTYVGFKLAFVADAYKKGFCILDDHPLEEIPYRDDYFDLVIMINVLDHVRDASKCMENAVRITRPGGILILGQDLTDEEDLATLTDDPGLVAHPVKLPEAWFRPHLATQFESIFDKVLPRNEGREPKNHYATLLFAGRKR